MLTKDCLRFHCWCFFVGNVVVVEQIYWKRHHEGQKCSYVQFETRFTHYFYLIQIEVHCCKNYLKSFLPEAGAFGNNIERELQKPRLKLKKKHVLYIFTEGICPTCNPMQVAVFFAKNVLILQNKSSFLTLKIT